MQPAREDGDEGRCGQVIGLNQRIYKSFVKGLEFPAEILGLCPELSGQRVGV